MRRRFARAKPKPTELMLVPMIDIFTVLVTFLLMTAVFSRITILELDLPSSASQAVSAPTFRLEVIVREEGLELTNGTQRIAVIPNENGEYGLKKLSELALSLKRDYPDAKAASVLLEPAIEYDHLIQVMDAIRTAEVPAALRAETDEPGSDAASSDVRKAADAKPVRVALFTDIAVGDAP
jgi:biopolymer transport protein ExbD